MKVKTKSGIYGWRERIKKVYSSYDELLEYDQIYNLAARLGNLKALWECNAMIEGSVEPADLRVFNGGNKVYSAKNKCLTQKKNQ